MTDFVSVESSCGGGSGLSYDRLLMPRSAGGLGKCRRRLSQLSSVVQSGDAFSELLLLVDWYVDDDRRFVRNERERKPGNGRFHVVEPKNLLVVRRVGGDMDGMYCEGKGECV